MTLNDFFAILRQRWRIIAATMLAVVAVACVVTIQTAPVYSASSRVYLVANIPSEDGTASRYAVPASDLSTMIEVASSPVVLDPVRQQLGLPAGYPVNVRAAVAENTQLFDVTVEAPDPAVAAAVATAVPQQMTDAVMELSSMLSQPGSTVEVRTIAAAGGPERADQPQRGAQPRHREPWQGCCSGLGFAVLRHNLDTRIRDVTDIAELSDRPVLARVPLRKVANRQTLFLDTDPFGPHAEAVRRMRTNLMFVDVTTRQHSFAITSPSASEGKTTTAINLAMAMADAGTRVLLVDADLRNPSVARVMGLEGAVGLTTVLLGRATLGDVVQQWGATPLFVLPAGEIPPNPSELLGSEAMRELFAQMTTDYEFVLFDTPPVLPVTDALVVDQLTGGTIVVLAANRTRKRHLQETLRIMETAGTRLGGFALNMVPGEVSKYYGYYKKVTDAEEAKRSPRSRRKDRRAKEGSRAREERLERARALAAAEAMQEKTSATDGLADLIEDEGDALEFRSSTRASRH